MSYGLRGTVRAMFRAISLLLILVAVSAAGDPPACLPDCSNANLSGAGLTFANLYRADLTGADLRDANLAGANLSFAHLTGADLRDASLHGATLLWRIYAAPTWPGRT